MQPDNSDKPTTEHAPSAINSAPLLVTSEARPLPSARQLQAQRLNMQSLAQEEASLADTIFLQTMDRLAQETQGLQPDATVSWLANAELRGGSGATNDVWLHLEAQTTIPLTCQRCMGVVTTLVQVDQWYRFVATEEIAMAEDDEAEEDLLVMAPQFDLIALLEDELLMSLPLVPMHETCPVASKISAVGKVDMADTAGAPAKLNPFAVLAQLKKN